MGIWRSGRDVVAEWWERWQRVLATGAAVAAALTLVVVYGARGTASDTGVRAAAPTALPSPAAVADAVPAVPSSGPAPVPALGPGEVLALQPGGPAADAAGRGGARDTVVHAFGTVTVGSAGGPLQLEVTNPLAYPVEVRSVTTPGSSAFAIRDDTCSTAVLAPRSTCRLAVVFAPTAAGDAGSSVAVRLRQVCTSAAQWPCNATDPQIRSAVPDGARTVLPSGRTAVDWTTELGDGESTLRVEGRTG